MKSVAISLALTTSLATLLPPLYAAEQHVTVVGAEFWAVPRHADQLLVQTPLKVAAQQLWVEPDAYLVLNHPSSEVGELWGLELQAWLVSLGIASDRIELRGGYEGDDGVAIIVVSSAVADEQGASVTAPMDVETVESESIGSGDVTVTPPPAVQRAVESQ